MVTTHGEVKTERQHTIKDLHSLLRSKAMFEDNEITDPVTKARQLKSVSEEILKAQDALDKAPPDPPAAGK